MLEIYRTMRRKTAITVLCLFGITVYSTAQESTPIVRIWDKNDHHQSNQIWSASCAEDGRTYFGNATGLICFDSKQWSITPIKGSCIIRSTFCDGDRIYAGSFEEFGYFSENDEGIIEYTSLSDSLAGYSMKNDEIWNIFRYGDNIIFHSFVTFFAYNTTNKTVTPIDTKVFSEYIGLDSENRLYSSADGFSIINLEDGSATKLPHPWKGKMVSVLPRGKGRDLVVTQNEGIYLLNGTSLSKWITNCEENLLNGEINKAIISSKGDIILGSTLYGCSAIDSTGHKLWTIDASNVLDGNTILNICENKEGDLFLAMGSGIALVDVHSGIRYIRELRPNVGAVYCTYYQAPFLYIGTNQGLYTSILDGKSLSINSIHKDKRVKGPVLYLKHYDDQLFCGTNADTYTIDGLETNKISKDNAGGSCLAKGIINGKEVLIEGTYTKLCLYIKHNGKWQYSHHLEGFLEPISTIDIDFSGFIWASHQNRGLYRLKVSPDLKSISDIRYYPSFDGLSGKVGIKRINGRTIFFNDSSIYTYDDVTDSIVIYKGLNSSIGEIKNIMDISEDNSGGYWIVNPDNAYHFDYNYNIIEKIPYSIFNATSVDMLKQVSQGPQGWSIMSLNNALAFIPKRTNIVDNGWKPDLKLESIKISHIDGSMAANISLRKNLAWGWDNRLVTFRYTYPTFKEIGNNHFEYMLQGRDEIWQKIPGEEVDLNHLNEGHHTVKVRVVDNTGDILDETQTSFYIRPPFWRSVWAYLFYSAMGILSILFVYYYIKRRVEGQKKELENKRLEAELNAKSREIASTTMSLLNKNKILLDLKDELSVQKNAIGNAYPDKYYKKMISAIDSQISSEQDWKLFQQNFDRIHGNFFHILKTRYPKLTSSDLRFCSYLCMNLSSKEIASMMNISLKGVEAARYRIRKKLSLPSNVSLSSFLMDLE